MSHAGKLNTNEPAAPLTVDGELLPPALLADNRIAADCFTACFTGGKSGWMQPAMMAYLKRWSYRPILRPENPPNGWTAQ
ncbi:MAG: hypothetical protein JXX14_25095 [Deltaproteobacteria bacterium]|nr:hypothetical protein [Deltaproteobacteria bacterium]